MKIWLWSPIIYESHIEYPNICHYSRFSIAQFCIFNRNEQTFNKVFIRNFANDSKITINNIIGLLFHRFLVLIHNMRYIIGTLDCSIIQFLSLFCALHVEWPPLQAIRMAVCSDRCSCFLHVSLRTHTHLRQAHHHHHYQRHRHRQRRRFCHWPNQMLSVSHRLFYIQSLFISYGSTTRCHRAPSPSPQYLKCRPYEF